MQRVGGRRLRFKRIVGVGEAKITATSTQGVHFAPNMFLLLDGVLDRVASLVLKPPGEGPPLPNPVAEAEALRSDLEEPPEVLLRHRLDPLAHDALGLLRAVAEVACS